VDQLAAALLAVPAPAFPAAVDPRWGRFVRCRRV
jgi:hypothetical protein